MRTWKGLIMRHSNERGVALLTTMLVMMLISALLVGFTTLVMSDQRYRFIDRDRGQAFYAASGALEKMTAELGNLFFRNVAPTNAQISALTAAAAQPAIPGVTFTSPSAPSPLAASELSPFYCYTTTGAGGVNRAVRTVGTNGYTISFCENTGTTNPTTTAESTVIRSGPYADLVALKTPYQLDVTARTASGGEVHLVRTIESVAIPVFQFGIFSDVDLAFNAADDFTFGGRVHTNGNLYLAEAASSLLTIGDKVTAVKEVVRKYLSNGVPITTSGHTGTVRIAKGGGAYQDMLTNWGSVVDGPTSAQNEPTWHTVSLSTYNSYIRNGRTGARALNLPLITVGGSTPDITRRPAVNEDVNNPILFNERLYTKASLRMLLSDLAQDITNLPSVTATAPVQLDGNWNAAPPAGYPALSAATPPIAVSPGPITALMTNAAGGTINFASAAAAAPFKPRFAFAGVPGVTITCTGKTTVAPWRLTGCVGIPAMPVTVAGTVLTAISPTGSIVGANAATSQPTTVVSTTIEFANAATLNRFNTMPFFDGNSLLVTCTGYQATSYTGCSSNPAAGTVLTSAAQTSTGVGTLGGFIKIERQAPNGIWTDVTMEILSYGIGSANLEGVQCADPSPNAIIRLQRLRDNANGCNYNTTTTGVLDPTNWWPNALYDTRESVLRDSNYPGATTLTFNGVMHYVMIDVGNLSRWFQGTAPYNLGTGTNSIRDNGGFTVYFSDRRNNRNELNQETGEYGWEDHVNPGAVNGQPNGTLDQGENVNSSMVGGVETQELYGGRPNFNGVYNSVPPGAPAGSPYVVASTPTTTLNNAIARVNRPIFFRRALKLVNGRDIRATGVTGLTVVAENPVYVQGDWNANPGGAGGFDQPHAATAVIADALTLLSNNWNDVTALRNPYTPSNRPRAANTWYRLAVIGGKNMIFPRPPGASVTFGTDGGTHAFLRYLEGNPAGADTIWYRGSMATFYYSRQATGVFKGSGQYVYEIPANRMFSFDIDFKNPSLLPPNTPVFRDMNAVGFSQELRPGR
jgi:hypothetical protein